MNSNFMFSEPLLKPYHSYGRQCWTLTAAQECSIRWELYPPAPQSCQHLYKDHVPNVTLYGSLLPISSTLCSRCLQFAGHCYVKSRWTHSLHSVFFNHLELFCMSYVKTQLCKYGLHSVTDLSRVMASREEWCVVCTGISVDVIAAMYSEQRRRLQSML